MAKTVPYVVRSGETLSNIAYRHGIAPDQIWSDPANAQLRHARPHPEILAPGDVLYVPVVDKQWRSVTLGAVNTFVGKIPSVKIKLKLQNERGPLKNLKYTVSGGQTSASGTTDAEGFVEFAAGALDQVVSLELPEKRYVVQLRVGGLDPVSSPAGARRRLRQLGYLSEDDDDDNLLRAGVRAFQAAAGLDVTGELDDKTTDALRTHYGC